MPELEPFCTIEGQMSPRMVGRILAGVRIDFPFQGVATGPHWEGERPVSGVDYATVRADGNMDLDIHGVIGEKRDSVGYTATGVSVVLEDQSAEINDRIGVAIGRGAEGKITLEVYLVKRA